MKTRRVAFVGLVNVLILGSLVLALEGASNLLLLAREGLPRDTGLAEVKHTRYDALLGWAHVPGVRVPNLYGPGVDLSITDRGFRGLSDVSDETAHGTVRILCSGDSFTLGYGVDDSDTWCDRLAGSLGAESVNMGQGGYGVDQAYLWYRRDGTIQHDVVVFAFIGDDFERARSAVFDRWDKPLLGLSGDSLQVLNYPVPRDSYERSQRSPWKVAVSWTIDRSSLTGLLRRLAGRTGSTQSRSQLPRFPTDEEFQVARMILQGVHRVASERQARLVTVWLPTQRDYRTDAALHWRRVAADAASEGGWVFWDLTEDLRSFPATDVGKLFIAPDDGVARPRAAAGHYSVAGNDWVAEELKARFDVWETGMDSPVSRGSTKR